jgi:paraquat-inducible protein A
MRRDTLARRAGGAATLIGPLLLSTLILLPASWAMPLFRTELLVFLGHEVTVLGAVRSLWGIDLFLCAVVVLFGMVLPLVKLGGFLVAWLALPAPLGARWIAALGKISKFSMLDIMLIAVTIVGFKGVGLGSVSVEYGLYVYAGVVIAALVLSAWMQQVAEGLGARAGR